MLNRETINRIKEKEIFKGTEYLVEATDTERDYLRKRFQDEMKWESDSTGTIFTISHHSLDGVDTSQAVTLSYATIDGVKVCFYYITSDLCVWSEAEAGMKLLLPVGDGPYDRWNRCDANNFHNCLCYISERNNEATN